MKKIFFLLLLTTAAILTYGQAKPEDKNKTKEQKKQERKERLNDLMKEYEEGSLIYSKQSAFGFKLNTDGWGVFYEHGKYKTIAKTNIWWLEFGERKNHKEEKATHSCQVFSQLSRKNHLPYRVGLLLAGN